MRWPFDKRVDIATAWGVTGVGAAFLLALPGLIFTDHSHGFFRWWWPTTWMAVPLAVLVAGLVMLRVPLRRSVPLTPVVISVAGENPATGNGKADQAKQPSPAPSESKPPGDNSHQPGAQLGTVEIGALADLLGEITDIELPSFRQQLYEGVPKVVRQQIKRNDKTRFELISLIRTFSTYQYLHPWQALLDELHQELPGDPSVDALASKLRELALVDN